MPHRWCTTARPYDLVHRPQRHDTLPARPVQRGAAPSGPFHDAVAQAFDPSDSRATVACGDTCAGSVFAAILNVTRVGSAAGLTRSTRTTPPFDPLGSTKRHRRPF